jgi:predicted DNA-binding WGR domain protein
MSEYIRGLEIRVQQLEKRAFIKKAMQRKASLRKASFDKEAAGKPYLSDRGLNRQKVRDGEASMLYKIDRERNQSKYYEILITQNPQNIGGYTLTKRWGRLGPKFQERSEVFKNLAGAKSELQRIELSKVKKGYISAFGDYHRAPNSRKLPQGQYPVGLESNAGSWSNQEVISCKPALMQLRTKLNQATLDAERGEIGQDLLEDLELCWLLTEDLTESMAQEVRKKMKAPLERLRGTNRRFKFDPFKIVKELKSLSRYLDLQLSLCSPVIKGGSVIKKASDSYRLTSDEVQAVDFARARYQWADIVNDNLRGRTLTLDNMTQHELREAIDEEGIPLLDDRSDLYGFLIHLEPV